ncbi:MAG: glycosyltransferase family 39 protein [Fimbriimonas sp.]|nr:glycosyltransferase family 39 protein [Fimbriimonas sp.]
MSRTVTLGLLVALIAVHIALATNYALLTPYRQAGILLGQRDPKTGLPQKIVDVGAPDERQHVNYVIHLLEGKGFPVFSPTDPNLGEDYQSHQPPAFYLLAAGWSKLTGASDLTVRDSGLKLRFLNVLIGGVTVLGTFYLAFWGFRRPDVALCAAAFAAFLPMFTALAGAVSNDPLLICLCTWVLALTARCLMWGWTMQKVLIIGVLTGLAMLTKTTALSLVPILLLAAFLAYRYPANPEAGAWGDDTRGGQVKPQPSKAMIAIAAVLAICIAGPWWARNQSLYHDPLAIGAFNDAFKLSAQKSQIVSMIEATEPGTSSEMTYWKDYIGWWTARSFFGVFGYMDIWMNERGTSFTGVSQKGAAPNTLYRLLLAVTVLCVLGWILAFGKAEWKEYRAVQIMNASFALIVLILFLRFNMQYFQAQARYLFPALAPISCGIAVGLTHLLGGRRQFAFPAIALLFLGVNLYAISILPEQFVKRQVPAEMRSDTPPLG